MCFYSRLYGNCFFKPRMTLVLENFLNFLDLQRNLYLSTYLCKANALGQKLLFLQLFAFFYSIYIIIQYFFLLFRRLWTYPESCFFEWYISILWCYKWKKRHFFCWSSHSSPLHSAGYWRQNGKNNIQILLRIFGKYIHWKYYSIKYSQSILEVIGWSAKENQKKPPEF